MGFEDESHRSFYECGRAAGPLLAELSLKKARKLAKRLAKQRASLFKLAGVVPLSGDALGGMVAELDRAYAEVNARVEELKAAEAAAASSSSSSSSDSEVEQPPAAAVDCGSVSAVPGAVDDTDASVLVHKLRSAKAAVAEEAATAAGGARGARVCALSVQDAPPAKVFVCGGKCCTRRGAGAVRAAVEGSAAAQAGGLQVVSTGCLGKCKKGAVLRVKAGAGRPELVTRVHESQVEEVLEFTLNHTSVQVAAPVL